MTDWLVLPAWNRLHGVSSIEWEDEDRIAGDGETLCKRRGRLVLPGVLSRMGMQRCAQCCEAAGVSDGHGVPPPSERYTTNPESVG